MNGWGPDDPFTAPAVFLGLLALVVAARLSRTVRAAMGWDEDDGEGGVA